MEATAEDCNAHIDARCLPGSLLSPSPCQITDDCIQEYLPSDSNVKVKCIDQRCRVVLECPIGFFSWENGCLPYATANQKCPAGSEQCIQGLLCVDGRCLGACSEGEILVDGKCISHGEPDCLPTDCEEDGCPTNFPICTLHDEQYQCCKPKSSRRANRHASKITATTEAQVLPPETQTQQYSERRRKPRILSITKYDLAKSRKRVLPASPTVYVYKPQPRSASIVSSVTVAPFLATLSIPSPRVLSSTTCIDFAEVQIGNQCYPRVGVGQGCTFTAQCPSSTVSINGNSPYQCINNICQLNIVCSAGYFRQNNACIKYSATGQSCAATTAQCITGSSCVNGTCYSGCETGELQLDGVCIGYADYGCILRSCESDTCPGSYPVCNYLRSQNAYVCCSSNLTNALVCANGELPQMSFGTNIPIDCVARSCARGYSCTHSVINGQSRYMCCPRRVLSSTTTTVSPQASNGLNGYLSVCMKQSMRPGCTPVSNELCFCSYPGLTTTSEPQYPTFTTGLPNVTTTTATATTTSTTTTTTTVTAIVACQTCTFADVTLVPGNLPGETPVVPAGIQVVNGCNQINVVCASGDPTVDIFMEFNGFIGGPTANNIPTVQATLTCINGQWTYSEPGTITLPITQVACFSSADTGITTTTTTTVAPATCASCTLDTPVLVPGGTQPGDIPTIPNGIELVNGCQQITAVCDASSVPGAYSYMTFNDFLGGPAPNFEATVTATMTCDAGIWYYTQGGVTTAINSVECQQGMFRRRKLGSSNRRG